METTQIRSPQFYDIVAIDLPTNLKSTHYYQLLKSSIGLEVGTFDQFPLMVLSMVQDPIANISMFYEDLIYHYDTGSLRVYKEQLEMNQIDDNDFFKLIGKEFMGIIEYISDLFKSHPEELEFYNYADFIEGGIMFIYAKNAEEIDRVSLR